MPYVSSHSPTLLPDILGSDWVSNAGATHHKWMPSSGIAWPDVPANDFTAGYSTTMQSLMVGYSATTNFQTSSLRTTGGLGGGPKV